MGLIKDFKILEASILDFKMQMIFLKISSVISVLMMTMMLTFSILDSIIKKIKIARLVALVEGS